MPKHSDFEKSATVQQFVAVEAQVTVTPLIKPGEPTIFCVDFETQPCCDSTIKKREHASDKCSFTVTQVICVQIPITFGVEVDVDRGFICGIPEVGPCRVDLATPSLPTPHELKKPPNRPPEPSEPPTE